MNLTEKSTVAEHLQALAEAEPEKFKMGGLSQTVIMTRELNAYGWYRIGLVNELTQDDWDAVLKEMGRECDIYRFSPTAFASVVRTIPISKVEDENTHFHIGETFPDRKTAKEAGGCAAIREYLKEK